MTSSLLTDSMNQELRAASPNLLSNDDLLSSVLSGCGDCIKVLDPDGRLQFMSEGGKRVMEVEDFSVLKGCPWPEFWVGDGNVHAAAAVEAAKAGKTYRFRGAANTAKGTPRYWDVQVSPIGRPDGGVSHLLSISRDITEEWAAAERERFLTEELEHRAKNTFSMVVAIANQTFRGELHASPLAAYNARVMALAKSHEIAKQSSWTSTSIQDVIDVSLASHRNGEVRFDVSGPALKVNPRQALSLTLAINELATNAVKYGALLSPDGEVDISWSKSAAEFSFIWKERGGPPVVEPTRQGFGNRVIRNFLANDFGGTVQLDYEPGGLVCVLTSPVENLP